MLDNSALLEASRHPTRVKPIGHGKKGLGKGFSSSGTKEVRHLGGFRRNREIMTARLIVGVKDGGVFLGDGGEEGGDMNREVLVGRQPK